LLCIFSYQTTAQEDEDREDDELLHNELRLPEEAQERIHEEHGLELEADGEPQRELPFRAPNDEEQLPPFLPAKGVCERRKFSGVIIIILLLFISLLINLFMLFRKTDLD
jgi:hypothetical protein